MPVFAPAPSLWGGGERCCPAAPETRVAVPRGFYPALFWLAPPHPPLQFYFAIGGNIPKDKVSEALRSLGLSVATEWATENVPGDCDLSAFNGLVGQCVRDEISLFVISKGITGPVITPVMVTGVNPGFAGWDLADAPGIRLGSRGG